MFNDPKSCIFLNLIVYILNLKSGVLGSPDIQLCSLHIFFHTTLYSEHIPNLLDRHRGSDFHSIRVFIGRIVPKFTYPYPNKAYIKK